LAFENFAVWFQLRAATQLFHQLLGNLRKPNWNVCLRGWSGTPQGGGFSVLRPGGLPAEGHYRLLKTLKLAAAEYKRKTRLRGNEFLNLARPYVSRQGPFT